jgi:hypothetical protein
MTTIMPEGEELRKAVKWISEERQDNPDKKISELIAAACLKFDLSPNDGECLCRTLKD